MFPIDVIVAACISFVRTGLLSSIFVYIFHSESCVAGALTSAAVTWPRDLLDGRGARVETHLLAKTKSHAAGKYAEAMALRCVSVAQAEI
jgi:hypothetical protein